MFDTMTVTKIVGALAGALLVFLLGNWAAELIYYGAEGAGEEEEAQGYVIDTGEEEVADAGEETVDFTAVMAAADPAKGERVYTKCKACHVLEDGANGVGPYLYGVVGRDIASADGYSYSDALASKEGEWSPENLSAFLEDPKGWAPGTKMGFAGLKKVEDRANVIAYLESVGG